MVVVRDRVDSWTDFYWGVLLTFYAPPVLAMVTYSERYTAPWQPENDASIEIWLHSNVIVVFLSDRFALFPRHQPVVI